MHTTIALIMSEYSSLYIASFPGPGLGMRLHSLYQLLNCTVYAFLEQLLCECIGGLTISVGGSFMVL